MLFAWVVPFGIAWWIFTTLAIIALFAAMIADDILEDGVIWLIAGIYLVLTCVLGTMNPLAWVVGLTGWEIAGRVGLYLGIGLVWSFFKWYHIIIKAKNQYINRGPYSISSGWGSDTKNDQELKRDILKGQDKEDYVKGYNKFGSNETFEDVMSRLTPGFSAHKVIYRILWWPLSVISFCIKDFLEWVINHVFKGFYMGIRNFGQRK